MTRPLVLVHGLWDTPQVFHRLIQRIDQPDRPLLAPHLPHGLGVVPLRELARRLDQHILQQFGRETTIDLLGFSMGGVIGRIWLQELRGAERTDRFFSVGSPQNGTLAALAVPRRLLAGVADMKPASDLLKQLNRQVGALAPVACRSYFCRWDLMVVPGWQARLPVGTARGIPVLTHQQLIAHPRSLDVLLQTLRGD